MKRIKDALQQIAGVDIVMVDKDEKRVFITGVDLNRDIVIDKLAAMGYA